MAISGLFNIFAKSPIKPMQKHMDTVYKTVKEFGEFCDAAFLKCDWKQAEKYHIHIMKLESEADDIKKKIMLNLPNNLFMAVDRGDLISLVKAQDKIANKAKHISSIVFSRKMKLPESIVQQYLKFLARCIASTKQARRAIHELDELIETGFKGKEASLVYQMLSELDQIERDTDQMQVDLCQELFKLEETLKPIDAMFLYDLINWTAYLADQSQLVGHRFALFLAK